MSPASQGAHTRGRNAQNKGRKARDEGHKRLGRESYLWAHVETADDLGLGWPTVSRAEGVPEAVERTRLDRGELVEVRRWSGRRRRLSPPFHVWMAGMGA